MAETRILCVEDEQPIRDLIAFGCAAPSYQVALAEDCQGRAAASATAGLT